MIKNFGLYIGLFGLLFAIQLITANQAKDETIQFRNEIFVGQDDFKPIETDEISTSVKHTVEKEYPSAGIAEAFIDLLGNYKLVLVMDQEIKVVYLDTNGKWYNPERRG